MNADKLKQNFRNYLKDKFKNALKLNEFEEACFNDAADTLLKTTVNSLPITQAYSVPELMKILLRLWTEKIKSWFEVFPESENKTGQISGVDIPLDHNSREQTKQLLAQLHSLFEI